MKWLGIISFAIGKAIAYRYGMSTQKQNNAATIERVSRTEYKVTYTDNNNSEIISNNDEWTLSHIATDFANNLRWMGYKVHFKH